VNVKRLSLLALALAGCSSSAAPGYSPPEDSGNPFADAAADTSQPGDATPDSASSETSDVADAAPEAAEDSQASDAASDSGEVGDAAVDAAGDATDAPETGDAADAAVDPAYEQTRCTAGSPRLAWSGSGCADWYPPSGGEVAPMACAFARHADGSIRCMPALRGPVVGFTTAACAANGVLIDTGDRVAGRLAGPAFVTVNEAGGPRVRRGAVIQTPANWYRMLSGTCSKSAALYIWNYSNKTASGGDEVPSSSFAQSTF